MPVTIIEQFKSRQEVFDHWQLPSSQSMSAGNLSVAEMFGNTLQGEGIWAGHSATFLRLQGCTLDCTWCDTASVWKHGNRYSYKEICWLLEEARLIEKLKDGQHLILTGGSPLKQQDRLVDFIRFFKMMYSFKPYIEVENECVLKPSPEFAAIVDCWNNSPKLENSGMKKRARWKPEVIQATAQLPNSWFKFVVHGRGDWGEIKEDFIDNGFISKDQVILMPEGQSQAELSITRPIVADLAADENILFSDRLHITIWDKKTGV